MPTCVDCNKKKQGIKNRPNGLLLCDQCFKIREEVPAEGDGAAEADKNDTVQDASPKLVANELLCYAFSYINCSTPEMLMKAIDEAFSADDIHDAKELLWQEYGHCLNKEVRRRDGLTRSATQAMLEDIILHGVSVIKNMNYEGNITFCALDVKKLPRFSPEEMNFQTL